MVATTETTVLWTIIIGSVLALGGLLFMVWRVAAPAEAAAVVIDPELVQQGQALENRNERRRRQRLQQRRGDDNDNDDDDDDDDGEASTAAASSSAEAAAESESEEEEEEDPFQRAIASGKKMSKKRLAKLQRKAERKQVLEYLLEQREKRHEQERVELQLQQQERARRKAEERQREEQEAELRRQREQEALAWQQHMEVVHAGDAEQEAQRMDARFEQCAEQLRSSPFTPFRIADLADQYDLSTQYLVAKLSALDNSGQLPGLLTSQATFRPLPPHFLPAIAARLEQHGRFTNKDVIREFAQLASQPITL